jgi:hypothetical protein
MDTDFITLISNTTPAAQLEVEKIHFNKPYFPSHYVISLTNRRERHDTCLRNALRGGINNFINYALVTFLVRGQLGG